MYPNLYFFLKETFHIQPWTFTQYINSFGLCVAISFVLAAITLASELKRKEKQGILQPKEEIRIVGEGARIGDLLFNFIFGFIVGYKILGVFFNAADENPQEYIFSSKGSLMGGLALALLFAGLKFYEKQKLNRKGMCAVNSISNHSHAPSLWMKPLFRKRSAQGMKTACFTWNSPRRKKLKFLQRKLPSSKNLMHKQLVFIVLPHSWGGAFF